MQGNTRITEQIRNLGYHSIIGDQRFDLRLCVSSETRFILSSLDQATICNRLDDCGNFDTDPETITADGCDALIVELPELTTHYLKKLETLCRADRDHIIIAIAPRFDPASLNQIFATGVDDLIPRDELSLAYLVRLTGIAILRRRNIAAVRAWEDRLEGMIAHATIGIFQTTSNGQYLLANPALAELYGYDSADQLMQGLTDIGEQLYIDPARRQEFARLMHHDGLVKDFESEIRRRDGHRIWISEHARAVRNQAGDIEYYEGFVRDITQRKEHEEQLRYLAQRDVLTSLPNRRLYQEHLRNAITNAEARHCKMALLYVDLDDFKIINDTMGHATGDLVLQRVAKRLSSNLHDQDTVARLSGDEFAVVLENLESAQLASDIARRLLKTLSMPIEVGDRVIYTSASIGIAVYPENGLDSEQLMQNADVATANAKSMGRNAFRFYNDTMGAEAIYRLEIENGLRHAIKNNELALHYQPKIDLRNGRLIGSEALLRWTHAGMGFVPPDDFIPVAEDTGMIADIGHWVIEEACRQIKTWQQQGVHSGSVAVNLSARQFRRAGFVEEVDALLEKYQLPAEMLEMELTERAIVDNVDEAIGILQALNNRGIKVSIDDFGTGHSSLASLKRFPIETLKIDRSFVMNIPTDQDDVSITRAIISLAKSLDLTIVAEGIEETVQATFLQALGVEYAQGYHFGKPMAADLFTEFAKDRL